VRAGKLLDAAPPGWQLRVADEKGAKGQHWNMQVDATSVGEVLAACAAEGRALDQLVYCWHEAPAAWDASAEPLPCSAVLDGRCLAARVSCLLSLMSALSLFYLAHPLLYTSYGRRCAPFRCAPFTHLSFFGGVGWVGGWLRAWSACQRILCHAHASDLGGTGCK
jgi:hypothetical protein